MDYRDRLSEMGHSIAAIRDLELQALSQELSGQDVGDYLLTRLLTWFTSLFGGSREMELYVTSFELNSVGSVHPPRVEVMPKGALDQEKLVKVTLEQGANSFSFATGFPVETVVVDPNNWFLKTEPTD